MNKKTYYFDNAATTQMSKSVLETLSNAQDEFWGNPSSAHVLGRNTKKALDDARQRCASTIGAHRDEVYFTSGGTESDNWAIKNVIEVARRFGKNHVITSPIEHHAVLNTLSSLDVEITYLPVYQDGCVRAEDVAKYITDRTCLVSVMAVNNEIGSIQPLKGIGSVCRNHNIPFHTDAVQGVGKIRIDVNDMNIDYLSMSGHKIHAPKGTGFMYCRRGVELHPFLFGGSQERGLRAGTENVPSIIALSKACTDVGEQIAFRKEMRKRLCELLINKLSQINGFHLNCTLDSYDAGIVNFRIDGVDGSGLSSLLSNKGMYVSNRSACDSSSLIPSHVLTALGLSKEEALGGIRVSFSGEETEESVVLLSDTICDLSRTLLSIKGGDYDL